MTQHKHIVLRMTWPRGHVATVCAAAAILMLARAATAHACPACKESLFDPSQLPQKLATARAYALSIGVMLAVPACLVGGIATLIIRSIRRARRAASAAAQHSPTP